MNREGDYTLLKVFIIIIVILWIMFEISTCMQYKDVPAGDVPKWVDWVL